MKALKKLLLGAAISALFSTPTTAAFCWSDSPAAQSENGDEPVNERQKAELVSKAVSLLKEHYIFPERVPRIDSTLKARLKRGEYASHTTLFEFLEKLNEDMEIAGTDRHLNIFYGPQMVAKIKSDTGAHAAPPPAYLKMMAYENYRLRSVERLDGNIGYFKLNGFADLELVKEALTSAMNFLAHSSAIVLDLRENGGGSAETANFLVSYFLPDSTYLGEFRTAKESEATRLYTSSDAAIKKLLDIPIYVLVGSRTSSAAEAVAYNLQQFSRARIIGEQTKGEGNPGLRFAINDKLWMMVPTAVSIHARTGTNWDRTGVTPDIKTEAATAYPAALAEACKALEKTAGDNNIYKWMLPEFEAQLNPQTPEPGFASTIAGRYEGGRTILHTDGALYFSTDRGKRRMNYLNNQTFSVEARKDFRLRFPVSPDGAMVAEILWNDGTIERSKKL